MNLDEELIADVKEQLQDDILAGSNGAAAGCRAYGTTKRRDSDPLRCPSSR